MNESYIINSTKNDENVIWTNTTNKFEHLKIISPKKHINVLEDPYNEQTDIATNQTLSNVLRIETLRDFGDKQYQTLVKDNSIRKNEPKFVPIKFAIKKLHVFFEETNNEIEEFRRSEDERLKSMNIEDLEEI